MFLQLDVLLFAIETHCLLKYIPPSAPNRESFRGMISFVQLSLRCAHYQCTCMTKTLQQVNRKMQV